MTIDVCNVETGLIGYSVSGKMIGRKHPRLTHCIIAGIGEIGNFALCLSINFRHRREVDTEGKIGAINDKLNAGNLVFDAPLRIALPQWESPCQSIL